MSLLNSIDSFIILFLEIYKHEKVMCLTQLLENFFIDKTPPRNSILNFFNDKFKQFIFITENSSTISIKLVQNKL